MALNPELLKRRKRIRMPRAPPRTLGAKTGAPLEADEKLEKLLEDLRGLAERETLFTSTLERDRLMTALMYGGYLASVNINIENQLAPGATVTTYLPVLPGFVYIAFEFEYFTSLPWWLTAMMWLDSDLPALPAAAFTRAPDHYKAEFGGIAALRRFLRYTVTNNHATDTANFLGMHTLGVVTEATWRMIEIVYLQPIVDYVRDKAEQLSGRPWP